MVPAMRTNSAVLDTTPGGFVAMTMGLEVKPLALVAAICQPGGGVTVRFAGRLVPLTVMFVGADDVPRIVEGTDRLVLFGGLMMGVPTAFTVTLTFVVAVVKLTPSVGVKITFWLEVPSGGTIDVLLQANNPAVFAEPPVRVEERSDCPWKMADAVGTVRMVGVAWVMFAVRPVGCVRL